MRTPAWARRTLAGARSPERASSLPAMLSCVTSTARPPELLGEGDGDRARRSDRTARRRRRPGARPRRAGRRPRRRPRRRRRSRTPGAGRPSRCTARRTAPSGTSVVSPCARRRRAGATSAASHSTSGPFGPATAASPPSRRRLLDHRHAWPRMAATRAVSRPAGPAPTTTTSRGRSRRRVPVRVLGLAPRRRLADARHDRVAGVADLARLVAAGARPDPLGLAGAQLGDEVGVGDLGPGHLDAGAAGRVVVAADRPLGLAGGVDDRALQDHRHVDGGADRAGQLDVEAGRLVEVGSGLLDREDRAAHDDDVVDAARRPARRRSPVAISGVMPAHGASSSHDRRRPSDAVGADALRGPP